MVEYIDIGGPSLLRAAAKNYRHVLVLSEPDQYAAFQEAYTAHRGAIPEDSRLQYRSEEHTSELQSHSFISYAVFCLKKKKNKQSQKKLEDNFLLLYFFYDMYTYTFQ